MANGAPEIKGNSSPPVEQTQNWVTAKPLKTQESKIQYVENRSLSNQQTRREQAARRDITASRSLIRGLRKISARIQQFFFKSKKTLQSTAAKTDRVAFKDIKELTRGKEKIVYRKREFKPNPLFVSQEITSALYIPEKNQPRKDINKQEEAFYAPVKTFWKSREKNLRAEKKTYDAINKKSESEPQHLATKTDEIELIGQSGKARYGLKVPFAEGGNFEDKIQENLNIETRIEFGRQYLEGMTELQNAGFIYGDIKPENCLIYGTGKDQTLKIADFGKTSEIKTNKKTRKEIPQKYSGNIRFISPEGKLSTKGEVWGAALVLIRNFEEQVLDKNRNTSLWGEVEEAQKDEFIKTWEKVEEGKYKNERIRNKRGIERFVIEHEAFQATAGSGWSTLLRRAKLMNLSQDEKLFQKQVLDRYIKLLAKQLKEQKVIEEDKVDQFVNLLDHMTQIDPDQRPKMEDALETYDKIFPRKNESIPSA